MKNGEKTVATICGERWPRWLTLTAAAAYCHMTLPAFRKIDKFANLSFPVGSTQMIDIRDLDHAMDAFKEERKNA